MYLELDHLKKHFDGREVVQDLSLTLEQGQLLCILGASGCGKTTTLNMIGGFLEPDSGSVRLENCKAGTILRLARAFHVSVEELLMHGGEHPADYPEHRAQSVPEDEQTALCALLHALSQLLLDS